MQEYGFSLFDTAVGRCAIAWSERGVVLVQLPEASEGGTRARVFRWYPNACESPPPPPVQRAVDGIAALLSGSPTDLAAVTLDMSRVPSFDRRVYELTRTIAPGTTISYGELAARLGSPRGARAVGQALRRNPFAIVVPCHRVLGAGGRIGGFSAAGGTATKVRLLSLEAPTQGA